MLTVAALVALPASAALAGGGVVGNPQPELAQFTVSAADVAAGGGTVLPDGNLVLAFPISDTAFRVCMLHPGSRSCVSMATLANDSNETLYGPPAVIATGGAHVSVILADASHTISYNSADDGKVFTGPVAVGSLDERVVATDAGGHIVTAGIDPHQGLVIQTVTPTGPLNSAEAVIPQPGCNYNPSISTFNGGVLVACDNLSHTYVYFAAAGSSFNDVSKYTHVATIAGQQAVDLSGNALLTSPSNSLATGGIIAFFNGSSFGATHRVPDSKAGDDGYWSMQKTGATSHVFFEGRRTGAYHLIEESTADGVHWSGQTNYGPAVTSPAPTPVLGPTGSGLVFETDATPQLAQPILNAQSVHVAFAAARVKAGMHGLLKGTAAPHLVNQEVTLERLSRGRWYPAASTHESAAGTFHFVVAGATATYRCVVSYKPGYFLYGYSNAATLTAVR